MLLKREDLQPVFSFKLRGAYNRMVSLTREELARGVIAASAGNHAQARAEVAAAGGHHFKMLMTDLAGDRFEFSDAEAVQLVGMAQLTWMHTHSTARGCNLRRALRQTAIRTTVRLPDCQTP